MKTKALLGFLVSGSLLLAACSDGTQKSPRLDDVNVEAIVEGSGERPTSNDVVMINYKGFLPDGSVFDQAEKAVLPLEGIIPGFSQALQKMQRGGKYIVNIPSRLGYGAEKAGPVPPNTDLKFEISLLDFTSRQNADELLKKANSKASEAPKRSFGNGVYVFSNGSDSDQSCADAALPGLTARDMRCASEAQWKLLCQTATLITNDAAKGLIGSVAFDEGRDTFYALESLIDNNKIYDESISWVGNGDSACKISFRISGYYNGNSMDRTFYGHATYFLTSDKGEVYIVGGSKDY